MCLCNDAKIIAKDKESCDDEEMTMAMVCMK